MRKRIVFLVLAILLVLGFFYFKDSGKQIFSQQQVKGAATVVAKQPMMRIGLVADSENDNENLKKALDQIKGDGANFVIGLGDWTEVGTVDELTRAKDIFDASKLTYYLTPGDHDLWDSRNRGEEALTNFNKVFGESSRVLDKGEIRIVLLDNSDIYLGISPGDWKMMEDALGAGPVTTFLPVGARSGTDSIREQANRSELRAAGNPSSRATRAKLTFVFAHKTPFHPGSAHIMGEESVNVARQAGVFLNLLQEKKVDGLFSGDLHFFAKFKSPDASVKITTVGAIEADRNFQGPRVGVLTIFDDWSWEVEDIEIR